MIRRTLRLLLPVLVVFGLGAGSSWSTDGVTASTQQSNAADKLKVSITMLSRGQETTINVSKISAAGSVVGSAVPDGDVLRWRIGSSTPDNLGGEPASVILNRVPLISTDGDTIIANRLVRNSNGMLVGVPSVLKTGTEWEPLPHLTFQDSRAAGLSRAGGHVVGFGWPDLTTLAQPWLWSAARGQEALPVALPTRGGTAWAVSDDGEVVVGEQSEYPFFPDVSLVYFFATLWTQGRMFELRDGQDTPLGQAFACSSDCSIVVGGSQGGEFNPAHPNAGQAWKWSRRSGADYLGRLPDAAPFPSYATDVSADGSLIIGTYYRLNEDQLTVSRRGFLWTKRTGLISILELMAKNGISHGSNWQSIIPTATTPDGDMILISGQDENFVPGGFILHLERGKKSRAND